MTDEAPSPKQIKAARALLAWTQTDLARAAKVAVSTVADFERGERVPVPNNAIAIRDALIAKGMQFEGGGVTAAGRTSTPTASAPGKPLRWIETRDLVQWAATREAQGRIPELVSRLILATYGPDAKMRFPTGDSVQLSGWDGECEVSTGSTHIPAGKSVWELGTQRNKIAGKAEDDYQKRTKKPLGVVPSQTTFVFLTPHPWPAKDEWAKQKRADGVWKDVQVIDGDTLVHWLEQNPGVSEWLAVQIGRRPDGLRNIREVWEEWSLATARPLTTELIVTDRDKQVAQVLGWLQGPPTALSIQAEAVDEAVAFLFAAIQPLPDLHRIFWESRILVPRDDAAARQLIGTGPKLVVVLNQADAGLVQKLTGDGHHVYNALGSDIGPASHAVPLDRPWRYNIQKALEEMGEDRHSAATLAKQSGRSLAVLRRLMPVGATKPPAWAEPPVTPALLAALLAGAWVENNPVDRAVLERLSGMKYEEIETALAPLASKFDSPIRRSGQVWRLTSLRDAWLMLAPNLTKSQLERFIQAFHDVLGAPSARYHSRDKYDFLIERGPPTTVSAMLRMGLGEAMIALAVHGDRAAAVHDASEMSERAVRRLLDEADDELWWSLASDFRRLAEASPEAFLEALENALDANPSPLASLFRSDEGFLHPREYLSDLLWALETLCWDPDMLGRVTDILARLAVMDPGGKVSNRPAETLRRTFLAWNPQTFATHDQRMAVLDMVVKRYPKVGWELLLAISPTGSSVSHPSAMPHWRDYAGDPPEPVTYRSRALAYEDIGRRVIAAAGNDADRWSKILDHWASFSPKWRAAAHAALSAAAATFSSADKLSIREDLRKFVAKHEAYPDATWSLDDDDLTPFRDLLQQLEPSAAAERYAYLFTYGAFSMGTRLSWEDRQRQHEEEQQAAAAEIVKEATVAEVLALAQRVDNPSSLGWSIATSSAKDTKKDVLLRASFASPDDAAERFASGLLNGLKKARGIAWVEQRFEKVASKGEVGRELIQLAFALPATRATWEKIAAAPAGLEERYWSRLNFVVISESEDARYVCEKLLAVNRGRAAVAWVGQHEAMPVETDTILAILRDKSTLSPDEESADSNDTVMFSYYVARVFKRLDKADDVSKDTLVHLEWAYFQALERSERPARTLHEALATDPAFFMLLMKARFLPDDGAPDALDDLSIEETQNIGSHAFHVLADWRRVPGSDEGGKIDAGKLNAWVTEVRRLAAEARRVDIVDEKIGEILSAAAEVEGEPWPPEPVREVFETLRNRHIESGFIVGLYNRRGVTVRMPTDGGEQERDLAGDYKKDAKALALQWPRTSAVLQRIAASYDQDARREDVSADINDF